MHLVGKNISNKLFFVDFDEYTSGTDTHENKEEK